MKRNAGTNTGEQDEKTAKQTCFANLETSQATSAGNSKSFDSCTSSKNTKRATISKRRLKSENDRSSGL